MPYRFCELLSVFLIFVTKILFSFSVAKKICSSFNLPAFLTFNEMTSVVVEQIHARHNNFFKKLDKNLHLSKIFNILAFRFKNIEVNGDRVQ